MRFIKKIRDWLDYKVFRATETHVANLSEDKAYELAEVIAFRVVTMTRNGETIPQDLLKVRSFLNRYHSIDWSEIVMDMTMLSVRRNLGMGG